MDDLRIGAVVRHVRVKRGWRQGDLADKAGVSRATISRIERGHLATLSVETIRRISSALDIRVELNARAALVIELKTDIVDVNDLVGGVDRKRRLAWRIARDRGWEPDTVSVWITVAGGRTNRARIAAHGAMLRAAFPVDGRGIKRWLRDPALAIAALSMWLEVRRDAAAAGLAPIRRVRRRREHAA